MSQWAAHVGSVELDLRDVKRIDESTSSAPLLWLEVKGTNQLGSLLATGTIDVELPR